MSQSRSIAVICGSSSGSNPTYVAAARATGRAIAAAGHRLVYGAGSVGLMGEVADEVLRQGGRVLGVIPQFLVDLEVGHAGLTELVVTDTMHERKLAMAEAADAFLALPGGIGTLEEIIEVFTWTQLGVHQKQCGLLNVAGYYDRLIDFVDHMVGERFLKAGQATLLRVGTDPAALIEQLLYGEAGEMGRKWLTQKE